MYVLPVVRIKTYFGMINSLIHAVNMLKIALLLLLGKKKVTEIHMLIWHPITCKYVKQNATYEIKAGHYNLYSS